MCPHALHPGAIQGKEGIKFCHLATLNEVSDNGSEFAGGEMLIHDNTVLVADRYTLVVRGRPDHGAWLYDNCLAPAGAEEAAKQTFFTGNFFVDQSPSG